MKRLCLGTMINLLYQCRIRSADTIKLVCGGIFAAYGLDINNYNVELPSHLKSGHDPVPVDLIIKAREMKIDDVALGIENCVLPLIHQDKRISLFLARSAKKVIGVEIVPEAIRDARINAEINGIEKAEFLVGAAEEVVPKYFEEHHGEAECRPDVIVVDPPRKGCDEVLLKTMVEMAPERIVYVSCDSATLARDLKWLEGNGYKVKEVTPCDMFGQTVHVESVVLLSKL